MIMQIRLLPLRSFLYIINKKGDGNLCIYNYIQATVDALIIIGKNFEITIDKRDFS